MATEPSTRSGSRRSAEVAATTRDRHNGRAPSLRIGADTPAEGAVPAKRAAPTPQPAGRPATPAQDHDPGETFSAIARQAVMAPLAGDAPHAPPAPLYPGEIELPYPREMVRLAAETFAALADSSRAQIVAALLVREMSVGDIATTVGLTQSATSHHLRLLRDRRLVRFHRHGNQVYYSIDDVHVAAMFAEAFRHIRHIFERLPDHPYRLGVEPKDGSR